MTRDCVFKNRPIGGKSHATVSSLINMWLLQLNAVINPFTRFYSPLGVVEAAVFDEAVLRNGLFKNVGVPEKQTRYDLILCLE